MARLESAWSQAAELAADDAAVSNLNDAVDLAAALVKLSRLVPVEAAPVCTVGFVTGSISARVARLLAWDETQKAATTRIRPWYAVAPVLVALCVRLCHLRPGSGADSRNDRVACPLAPLGARSVIPLATRLDSTSAGSN